MKQGFRLEKQGDEWIIMEGVRVFKPLGKISQEQAEFELDQIRMWMNSR